MPTLAIEISDAGILAASDSAPGVCGPSSPGFALIDDGPLLVGAEAQAQSRLKPRRVDNRFWSDLGTVPLAAPFPAGLSRADLAHAHLAAVWERAGAKADSVILALPGTTSAEQLGLTLGIARACEIPVVGMVDAAVAAAAAGSPDGVLLHVDLQLHRAVVTELSRGNEIVRRQSRVGDRVGLVALHDVCVKRIAELFVRATRFDPLHAAATEQDLFSSLPRLFEELRDEETAAVEIVDGSKAHAIELDRGQLLQAIEPAYVGIVDLVRPLKRSGEEATLLLTHRVHTLPGLGERLGRIGDTVVRDLSPESAVRGALRASRAIRSDGEALPFVTRLPVTGGPATGHQTQETSSKRAPPRRRAGGPPTHLLYEERAYRITADPLVLGVAPPAGSRGIRLTRTTAGISRSHCSVCLTEERVVVRDHSSHGLFVNGQRVDGATELVAGDKLRLGTPGIEIRLIRAVEPDGPAHG